LGALFIINHRKDQRQSANACCLHAIDGPVVLRR